MFISHPDSEFAKPFALGTQGCRHWRAVEVSGHLPWFIATLQRHEDGIDYEWTALFAWDLDLVTLMQRQTQARLTALQMMERSAAHNMGRWRSLSIKSVWRYRDPSGQVPTDFVFITADGQEFCGMGDAPASHPVAWRELVAQVGE